MSAKSRAGGGSNDNGKNILPTSDSAGACLLATVLVLGSSAGSLAQGTKDTNGAANSQKSNTGTGMGGTATSGTGVRTGKGPLSQPIPPATSTTNPQQNPQQNPQRPQNTPGPAQTNPPQEPFGSR
jgi:hypothetical protein